MTRIRIVLFLILGCVLLGSPACAKEEIVYAVLGADGSAPNVVSIVNRFEAEGEVVDYGTYTAIRNLTFSEPIRTSGDEIRFDAGAGWQAYEGVSTLPLPWLVSLRYELDGETIAAGDLAGASGLLHIHLEIVENPASSGSFARSHALQLALSLDTARCSEIIADGATIANVGTNKQLSYILLPAARQEIDISTKVTNFEMEGFSINGIRLIFQVRLDAETEEIAGRFLDGLDRGDEGATALADGASMANWMAQTIQIGSVSLSDSAQALSETVDAAYTDALSLYEAASEQAERAQSILDEAESICQQMAGTELYETMALHVQTAEDARDAAVALRDQAADSRDAASDRADAAKALARVASALSGSTETLSISLNGVSDGVRQLSDGLNQIRTGIQTWTDELGDAATASDLVNAVLFRLFGGDIPNASFVSDQNDDQITMVQFVMRTEPIRIPEADAPEMESYEEPNAIQKFFALFR